MDSDNLTSIMLAVYNDHLKAKVRDELKLKKLELRIRILHTADNPDFVLIEKLTIDMDKVQNKLADTKMELDLLQKRLDGGASLDNFLEQGKVQSK